MAEEKYNSQNSERRAYARLEAKDIVNCSKFSAKELFSAGISLDLRAVTKNISGGGVLFESDEKMEVGDLLKIEISLNGWDKFKQEFYRPDNMTVSPPLVVLGTVVRVESIPDENKFDIGVCFAAIDSGHKFSLIKYIGQKKD
ncbi:MAG: PilZ domain-containing protein [Candidatus Omnitrophica bacterium]|nr:PilZ domain-containing protein [Candidatus Omnitrophota bacterium]